MLTKIIFGKFFHRSKKVKSFIERKIVFKFSKRTNFITWAENFQKKFLTTLTLGIDFIRVLVRERKFCQNENQNFPNLKIKNVKFYKTAPI